MDRRQRPYLFYDTATSICGTCLRRVDAKIVFQDECVWMLKRCPEHGKERVLIADDIEYWRKSREVWIKPSEMPAHFGTPVKYGDVVLGQQLSTATWNFFQERYPATELVAATDEEPDETEEADSDS